MKYLFLILLCLTLCGCSEKIYTDVPDGVIIKTIDSTEVYSDTYLYDLITIDKAEINSVNKKINTRDLKTEEIEVFYTFNKKKYVYTFDLTVKDNIPPKILGSTIRTVQVNYEGDLCNLIMYGDNYDKNPECIIDGSYDISKTGSYNIRYTITDNSTNKAHHTLVLHVIKPENTPGASGNTSTLAFSEVLDRYKNDRSEIGIDVSKWQGNIDFEKVKKAGATFVMMRIGVQKSTSGELEIDEYYLSNIEKAKKANLKVGVYLYSIATSKEESIKQAEWVLDKLNGVSLDLPIVFDWESWSWWNVMELSFHDINEIADSFLNIIEENGYQAMLYGSKFYLENIWENKKNYPVWLAHYTNETNYIGDYIMWQLSDVGRIDGINGNVDINILYNH